LNLRPLRPELMAIKLLEASREVGQHADDRQGCLRRLALLCFAADTRAKIVNGVDDHSRLAAIAPVVPRATGRAVCLAFVQAMRPLWPLSRVAAVQQLVCCGHQEGTVACALFGCRRIVAQDHFGELRNVDRPFG
jgi:hypothetical protein